MPEGPEAASIVQTIHSGFANKRLAFIDILKGRYVNHGPPANFDEFKRALPLKLDAVNKKGKVIFIHFEKGWTIISRLGMTGWWYTEDRKPDWRAEVKSVVLKFKSVDGESCLIYSDPRSYGTLTFTNDATYIQKELEALAPDIMDRSTTYPVFRSRSKAIVDKKPSMPIEELLSDQKRLVSGIGNYLKSEIMYSAKIAPTRHIRDISENEWSDLYTIAKRVSTYMQKALRSNKEDEYESKMRVYSKKTDPLGNEVKRYSNKAGRTVHWVPAVQS
jgi:endonuclease-8